MGKTRIVHYINQFYGGIGGEEHAGREPEIRAGVVGPGMAITAGLGQDAEIVATVVCGDGYFNENVDKAIAAILEMIKPYEPELFIAGPAFNAGRYGVACGAISKAVQEELKIPAGTAMYTENPGADMYKKDVYVLSTGSSAAAMRQAAPAIAKFALKLAKGEVGSANEEGYLPRGIRKNVFVEERGSKRAVDMLLKKIKGEPFETEYAMPVFDQVPPNPAVKDMSKTVVALVTSGGIVPKTNPDRIESSSASKYGEYNIEGIAGYTSETGETAHGGYDPVYANQDPNRVLPMDVLRDMEKEGIIGKLHNFYYTTVGNGTSVASAKKFAAEIGAKLKNAGVQAVILTST
jgi:glycine reductase